MAKKKSRANQTTMHAMRVSDPWLAIVDGWVDDINKSRAWPKTNRSELIRKVMEWAARERPEGCQV